MDKLDEDDETVRLYMVTTKGWMKRVDAWWRKRPDVANRSAAIRQLVDMALKPERRKPRSD